MWVSKGEAIPHPCRTSTGNKPLGNRCSSIVNSKSIMIPLEIVRARQHCVADSHRTRPLAKITTPGVSFKLGPETGIRLQKLEMRGIVLIALVRSISLKLLASHVHLTGIIG